MSLLQSGNLLVDILKLTLLSQAISSLCGLGNLFVQGHTDVGVIRLGLVRTVGLVRPAGLVRVDSIIAIGDFAFRDMA